VQRHEMGTRNFDRFLNVAHSTVRLSVDRELFRNIKSNSRYDVRSMTRTGFLMSSSTHA